MSYLLLLTNQLRTEFIALAASLSDSSTSSFLPHVQDVCLATLVRSAQVFVSRRPEPVGVAFENMR